MNIANQLTVLRIVLTFVFICLILQSGLASKLAATLVFALASFTDFLDGYLARKYQLISNFGKIMDPIADKFLTLSAFFIFCHMGIIELWMVIVIVVREIGVTLLRFFVLHQGRVVAADKLGKYKTVSQIFAIGVILIFILIMNSHLGVDLSQNAIEMWERGIFCVMIGTVVLTLLSGVSVLRNNWRT